MGAIIPTTRPIVGRVAKGGIVDAQFPNQLMQQRIVSFVEEALAAKRFTRVETGGDLLVNYDLKVTAEPQLTTLTDAAGPFGSWDGWGWGGWGCCGWGSGFSTTTAQTYWIGTLVVSLTDSHQKQLVFQGVSTDMISSRAGKNTKRLQKGINEMFEKYPPEVRKLSGRSNHGRIGEAMNTISESARLQETRTSSVPWKKWGPYLSERQWGTVREDYSQDGNAWDYFSHDQARSRAYRWGEDGLAGICDDRQLLCFTVALWNGRDPILKERLFGLTNREGNHGEDVKEYYFYLDSTPTHSYMKYLYKYPHAAFPYDDLVRTNKLRNRCEMEYELMDTGVFDGNRYFDVFVEYVKNTPEDVLIQISVCNRGPDTATLHVLPTLWFRNTWSWSSRHAEAHFESGQRHGRSSHYSSCPSRARRPVSLLRSRCSPAVHGERNQQREGFQRPTTALMSRMASTTS